MSDETTKQTDGAGTATESSTAGAAQTPTDAAAAEKNDGDGRESQVLFSKAQPDPEGDSKSEEVETKKDAETKPEPIEYTDFKLPEGQQFDEKVLGDFKAIAKEAGLSQEAAQKIIDLQASITKAATDAYIAAQEKDVQTLKSDPVLGQGNLDKTIERGNKALKALGDDEFISDVVQFGLGNKLSFARFLVKAHDLMEKVESLTKEDKLGVDGGVGKKEKSIAEIMFPNMG